MYKCTIILLYCIMLKTKCLLLVVRSKVNFTKMHLTMFNLIFFCRVELRANFAHTAAETSQLSFKVVCTMY